MKTKSALFAVLLFGISFSNIAKAEIALVPGDTEVVTEPEQSFEERVDEKVSALLEKVRNGELRDAYAVTRQLQAQIAFEMRKNQDPGDCNEDRRCDPRSLR